LTKQSGRAMLFTMCDTFVKNAGIQASGKGHTNSTALFGKNSDRHPDEPQMLFVGNADLNKWEGECEQTLDKYTEGPLIALRRVYDQLSHPYQALISRPIWMWGGEMGLNERGVAIGNEAVFSRWIKKQDRNKKLLGMDLLRLALHNAATAREAVDILSRLIEGEGQGGNGAYKGSLYYDNSFLIADQRQAFILETADHHWAVKSVTTDAISNSYSIKDDFEASDQLTSQAAFCPNGGGGVQGSRFSFALHNESKLHRIAARGRVRRARARQLLDAQDFSLSSAFSLLRDHGGSSRPHRGMKNLCMHSGRFIKSQTTASMVIEYGESGPVAWLTGAPHPCVALFQPWSFAALSHSEGPSLDSAGIEVAGKSAASESFGEHLLSTGPVFQDYRAGEEYALQMREINRKISRNYPHFEKELKPERDRLETACSQFIQKGAAKQDLPGAIQDCRRAAFEYLQQMLEFSGEPAI